MGCGIVNCHMHTMPVVEKWSCIEGAEYLHISAQQGGKWGSLHVVHVGTMLKKLFDIFISLISPISRLCFRGHEV